MSRVLEGRIDIFKGKTRGPQLARKCAGRVFHTAASTEVDKLDAKVDECPETAQVASRARRTRAAERAVRRGTISAFSVSVVPVVQKQSS